MLAQGEGANSIFITMPARVALFAICLILLIATATSESLRNLAQNRSLSTREPGNLEAIEIPDEDLRKQFEDSDNSENGDPDKQNEDADIEDVIDINDDPHKQKERVDSKGLIITPRIVSGTEVARGKYPWLLRQS